MAVWEITESVEELQSPYPYASQETDLTFEKKLLEKGYLAVRNALKFRAKHSYLTIKMVHQNSPKFCSCRTVCHASLHRPWGGH